MEMAVVRAGTHKNASVSGTVLSGIDENYFYNDHAKDAFNRIQELLHENGEVPRWQALCNDPELSEETREKLQSFKVTQIDDRRDALHAVKILDKYRKLRGMFSLSELLTTKLKRDKVAVEETLNEAAEALGNLRQARNSDATIVKFGKGNNATKHVMALLDEQVQDYLPTSFDEFDSKNGGIGFGNLFVLGGSSGAGKSTLAAQLAINWSKMGEHVVMVPLEMTENEMVARTMANAAKIDVRKILFRKMSEGEKDRYRQSYKKFVRQRKKEEGTLTYFKPKSDMTIEEILACTYVMGPKVIIIDYISLLKGVDGDDSWQKLGAVARYCKIYAENHHCIVVLLCQVSEEGKIRYAQAIKEHANYAWVFVATKETREAELLNISQIKARNGELYDFSLKAEMAFMRVRSMTDEERNISQSKSHTTKKKGKEGKGGKEPAYLQDVSDEE